MTAIPDPEVRVTAYQVSCLPIDHPSRPYLTITVRWRGGENWSVHDQFSCLSSTGKWDVEPRNSARADRWERQHWFPLDTALALARKHAPLMSANGLSVEAVLANTGTPSERRSRRSR